MVDDRDNGKPVGANDSTAVAPTSATSGTAVTQAADQGEYLPFELPPAGYQLGSMLGMGGMGEVIIAQDQRVGREVAYKRMRNPQATNEALTRFLREARIQARLDHPAIVPVYELGKDADGRPFFTMKRLTGKTLADHLRDPDAPRQRLLRAFTDVCLALDFAHSRSVVHRDLKPQNIMLGDFGEVYVLDWGIARVLDNEPASRSSVVAMRVDIDSIGDKTSDGTLLGTVGYMAPEQIRGEAISTATDVYALGAILFEVLAGEPLHPRGHPAVQSTLTMETASPAQRRPERAVPPELDALCGDALVSDPAKRPTARELANRMQKYLDGDRDLERRRTLARERLAVSREAVESGDPDRRADALRSAGRALALDPEYTEAAELVTELLLEPPKRFPAELQAALDLHEVDMAKARARKAAIGMVTLLSVSTMLAFLDIKSWSWLVAIFVGMGAFITLSWRTYRTGKVLVVPILIGTVGMAVLFSRLVSPFMLVPVLMCGTAVTICNIPYLNDRRWILYLWMLAASTVPQLLEWAGVLRSTTHLEHGRVVIESAIFGPAAGNKLFVLTVANAVFLMTVVWFIVMLARDRRVAQRELTIQAWHLHQLLPKRLSSR